MLAAVTWIIWYYTKVSSTAAWLGATTLNGDSNAIMLERSRQRTQESRQALSAERKLYDARIQELINENRLEHQAMMYALAAALT